jgi:hypothetical protein
MKSRPRIAGWPLALAASLLAASLVLAACPARAECACRCVEGEMRAVCSNPVELAPVCPPAVCPIAPPAIRPIEPPMIAPPGASRCAPRQVLTPATGRYEWRTLCR